MIAYTVHFSVDDPVVADEWIEWLENEHLDDVFKGGATDAEIVRMEKSIHEDESIQCEVRYHFPDRETFETYLRDHAPRTRAAGMAKFPMESGLRYERSIGQSVCQRKA